MAKPFSELEAKMSPESRRAVDARVAETLRQMAKHDAIVASVRERVQMLFGDSAVVKLEPDKFESGALLVVETTMEHLPADERLRQLESWWVDVRPDDGSLDIGLRYVTELQP